MNLTLLASLISALAAGAVGYGTAAHFGNVKITELELTHANERIAIQRQSRAALERATNAVAQAQADAQARAAALTADRDSARAAADRLRNASTTTVRAAADDPAACSATVSTYDVIFAECAAQLREVAEVADRAISDNQALIQGWAR